jgi:hypothetical protein
LLSEQSQPPRGVSLSAAAYGLAEVIPLYSGEGDGYTFSDDAAVAAVRRDFVQHHVLQFDLEVGNCFTVTVCAKKFEYSFGDSLACCAGLK